MDQSTQRAFALADKSMDPLGIMFLGLTWLVCRWGDVELNQDEAFVILTVLGAARVVWERVKRKYFIDPYAGDPPL